ncbi:FAD-dependent oxidoreductase [Brevibacillus sp. GCM10020057]|uniref:FAD-dependent oxidoreductase n=1 Tax=Brevibacillus sp. GCM10020057 TaxID=3317327 RepID=UPI00363189CB
MFGYDVVVIGGGQAGLSIGYMLKQLGLRFTILEKHGCIGTSWRNRYDSLVLYTPRYLNDLPALPFPGERGGLPDKNETADYLEQYAQFFALPLKLGVEVIRLERAEDAFLVYTRTRPVLRTRAVVVATVPFNCPIGPPCTAMQEVT